MGICHRRVIHDRDVGEIRAELRDFRQATVGSINALRVDFVGLRAHVDSGFAEMRDKFAVAGQRQIVTLLETLTDRDSGGDR